MPRIRCHYDDCVFLEDGYCGAAAVEIEPDSGCLTFSRADDAADKEDEWDEEELEDLEDDDEYYDDDEDEDDLWDGDEEEDY